MAFWPWGMQAEQQASLITVFCEEICAARSENWQLMYPSDARLESWLEHVRMGELPPRLGQLAQIVGACERTISRIFIRDTGMNYQNWRQQWRLLRAIEMLSEGIQISEVAQQLEFISDSAFIVFSVNIQVLLQSVIYRIFLEKVCINKIFSIGNIRVNLKTSSKKTLF